MVLAEAKTYEGQTVSLSWVNRKGEEISQTVAVFEVAFVPMYGPCFVTECGNVPLDKVVAVECPDSARRAA